MRPLDSWQADPPPAGFADRVTAAVLRDASARGRGSRRRDVRARVVFAVAACLAVSGVAWAWSVAPRNARLESPLSRLAVVERTDPTPSASPPGPVPLAYPGVAKAPPAVRVPPPAPHPSSSALPPSPPKVPLPACRCNAFACECGPE